jgi:TPP-dependent 2-oxoacid decarboxylase
LKFSKSDPHKLSEAVRDTVEWWNKAKHPAIIFGIETQRYRLTREIVDLAERLGAPCMTSVLAKGAFPMDHPLHMGVHIGPLSPKAICKRIDRADLVLSLGTLQTDMNLGSRPLRSRAIARFWRSMGGSTSACTHTPT